MFFRVSVRARRRPAPLEPETPQFTPENSGLNEDQIKTARISAAALQLSTADEHAFTRIDMVQCLYTLGLNPTDDSIEGKLRALKIHQNQHFSFGHVCHVWNMLLKDLQDEEEMLMKAFQFFDKDGNGEISITELKTTMHELGDLLTEQEIQLFVSLMDDNNDGVIGFSEFIKTLKSQTPEEDSSSRRSTDNFCRMATSQSTTPPGAPASSKPPDGAVQEASLDIGLDKEHAPVS